MISACVRSTACLASLKTSCGLLRTTPSAISTLTVSTGARCAGFHFIAAEGAVLESDEPWSFAGEADVGREFALEHLASEQKLLAFFLEADAIADDGASHGGREFGNEVAHLVGVRHQHQLRLLRRDELLSAAANASGV